MSPGWTQKLPASLSRQVLDACAAPLIIFQARTSGCMVCYVNPAFSLKTGYSAAEVAHMGWVGLHMDGGRQPAAERLYAAIRERRALEMPIRIGCKDGLTFSAALQVSPVARQGVLTASYAVGVLRDQTASTEYLNRLERDVFHEPLTGLPNRRLLAERAERAIAQALREDHLLGVALVDLDGFKTINDTWGHAAGDEVLRTVGARLAGDSRPGDLVARLGGDEFVLLLQPTDAEFSLPSVVERVTNHLREPIRLHGHSVTVSCSIGVAVCPGDGEDLDALLEHADRAMYREKGRRRLQRSAARSALHYPAPA